MLKKEFYFHTFKQMVSFQLVVKNAKCLIALEPSCHVKVTNVNVTLSRHLEHNFVNSIDLRLNRSVESLDSGLTFGPKVYVVNWEGYFRFQ